MRRTCPWKMLSQIAFGASSLLPFSACSSNDASSSTAGASGGAESGADAGTGGAACEFPTTIAWNASAPLISPTSDATHDLVAVKDPTVVRFNDRWHVYGSYVSRAGAYNMFYTSFADWAEAPNAPLYYMD
jgi:endo-1,4-beta-xylanase